MKKKILILALLIFIASIGCASAAEDADALSLEDTDEVLTADPGTFNDLQEIIDNAELYETIELDTDYYGNGTEIAIVNKTITIQGNGHILNASCDDEMKYSRIFNIDENSEVHIYNLNFTGGFDNIQGGAILNKGTLFLTGCTFMYNAGYYGGAIYNTGSLYMDYTSFNINHADSGGAIYTRGETYMENTIFNMNSAEYSGGAVHCVNGKTEMAYCQFFNNTADVYASAVQGGNILSIVSSSFISFNDDVEFVDYYNKEEMEGAYLNLNNNGMYSLAPYPIVYDNWNPINSQVTLEFFDSECEQGDAVEIAIMYDNMDNAILFNRNFTVKIYNGSELVDEVNLTYDEVLEGYYYYCDLENGTYTINGTISKQYVREVTVIDGELVVGGSSPKITPNVTTTCNTFGDCVTLTATLEPSDATGIVSFYIGEDHYDPEIDDGKASYTVPGLADGTYTVKTVYRGDENYNHANAKDVNFTINSTANRTASSAVTTYVKDSSTVVTLTTTITPSDATGTVTYLLNGEEYNPVTVTDGKATKKLSGLPDGTYTVEALYSGDGSYYPSNATPVNFTISTTGLVIDAPPLVKYYGGSERFTVTLTEDGLPLANKTVTINLNGKDYERTTDSSGIAGMNVNLNSGVYPVTVTAEGQSVNTTVTVMATVSGENVTKIFRNGTQYYATFVDSTGKTLPENTGVEFNINGVFYTRYTNENGVARMNINLNPGEYIITAKNPKTGEMYTNLITVLTNIVENNDLVKYYKNDSQYRIRILADDGSIAGEGVKVTFNINGVFYDRYSDNEGYVQLKINLNPGEYIITADYNGLMASNNITVLNVLFGHDLDMEYRDGSKYTVLLLDGQGNPYSNQTIEININGVFYYKVTNESGIAALNINLDPASYIATATYNGLSCSNTVNVAKEGMVEYDLKIIKISLPKSATIEITENKTDYLVYSVNYRGDIYKLTIDGEHTSAEYKNLILSEGGTDCGTYHGWKAVEKIYDYFLFTDMMKTCFGFDGADPSFVRSTVDAIEF